MDFREEYKKSEKLISPTDEQIQRMISGVMSKTESGKSDAKELKIAPEKKAFPFKRIALIGGSIAACAAITIAAVNIAPKLGSVQTTNCVENPAILAADSCSSAALEDSAATTVHFEAEEAVDAAETQGFDSIANFGEKSIDEAIPADSIATAVPNHDKENPGAAGAAGEPDNVPANESDAEEIIYETHESDLADYPGTIETGSSVDKDVGAEILTAEPCENDGHENPSTGADPDLIAAWEQAVENSPLVCFEDFDSDFEKPLTNIEFTSEGGEDGIIIIGDKTYKLTNQVVEDEWTMSFFSMSSEEIATLPFEYFTTRKFSEYQRVYKVFFAEDRCFVVYLLDTSNTFINPQGEYVLESDGVASQ